MVQDQRVLQKATPIARGIHSANNSLSPEFSADTATPLLSGAVKGRDQLNQDNSIIGKHWRQKKLSPHIFETARKRVRPWSGTAPSG